MKLFTLLRATSSHQTYFWVSSLREKLGSKSVHQVVIFLFMKLEKLSNDD